ncbi:hypothetical protein AGMMS49992_32180 [Clostridia bacterium]|nr:hypothetical protein AGMMS49992_32180 [Clostridia bacterium]
MVNAQTLLDNITDKQLRDFVTEYAQRNSDFADTLAVRFADPDFDAEVKKIESITACALYGANDYRHRGDWGHIVFDLRKIDDEIEQRTNQGQYRLAFAQAAAAYTKLLEVYEYQEECEISDEAESYINVMTEIAEMVKESSDGEYILNRCIELANDDTARDYGADYQDKFLLIGARFVTVENRETFDSAIAQHSSGWRGGVFALIELTVIKRLDGESAAKAFIKENLQFDEIRKIAYNDAMSCNDYENAAQLCLTAPENHYWQAPNWKIMLYNTYEAAGNTKAMAETAESMVLSGNLDYYDKLKSIHKKLGDWDAAYPNILVQCKTHISSSLYMQVLSKENEFALLLEQVQSNPHNVYTYGAQLASQYSDAIYSIFITEIGKEAARANNRKDYAAVCGRIKTFRNAGFMEEAGTLICEYKIKYVRRPAFVDELKKI